MFVSWESVLVDISLFFTLVFLCIYVYFKYSYTYWSRKGVPHLTPKFPLGNNPIIGPSAFTYGLETRDWYNEFKKMGARFGGVWSFCNKALVLVDTEIIKDVMTKDFNDFINRDFFHNPHDDPRSNNLFVTENEEWRYMRQKMSPAFTSAKMKYMFECVSKCSDGLVDLFEKVVQSKDDIPIRLFMDKYTMDNIGVVAFGLNFDCLLTENDKFRQMADLGLKPNLNTQFKRLLIRIAPKLCLKFGLGVLDKTITDFFGSIVLDNVEQRRKLNTKRNDFTQLLLDIQEESRKDKTRFTMDDLIANCIIFFLAGFDTSSKTMQYTLIELAQNQQLQGKARNDIKRVLDKYNGKLTYEGLQEMVYLRQVVDETLRLYPPVLTLSRIAQKNYKIRNSDTIIEEGTTALISVLGLHTDPDLFPHPQKYDPERFSPSNKSNIVPYSYLPFGEGPRNCIGRRFGSMQSLIGLVRLLSKYQFDPSPKMKYPLEVQYGQFLFETEELYLKASKLN